MTPFRPLILKALLALLPLAFVWSCGKSSSQSGSTTSLIDLTKYDVLQFKAASSSFGVGGNRYDLNLGESRLEKFGVSNESSTYQSQGSVTLSESVTASLETKLQKVAYRKHGTCSDCTKTRASVWIEITNISKPLYYFANEGDCSCPADGENAPTLNYEAIRDIYDQLLGAF